MTGSVDEAKLKHGLVTMLAATWRRVDWRVMQRKDRSKADVFATRLYDASHEATLDEAIDTICGRLGVGVPAFPSDTAEFFKAYDYCMKHEDAALNMLERRPRMLACMTSERAYGVADTTGEAKP